MSVSRQPTPGWAELLESEARGTAGASSDARVGGAFLIEHAAVSPDHAHRQGHLVHAASGVLSLTTGEGTWIAPATRFAWVPAGCVHRHRAHGRTDMRIVYLDDAYQQTIVGRSKRAYVWLMARTPSIPEADYAAHIERIRGLGYDVDKIRRVPQSAADPSRVPDATRVE